MDFEKLPRFKPYEAGIVLKVSEWCELFNVDLGEIERQVRLAHGWADANPKKAPKVNMMRYLFNWLTIAQRKGSLLKKPRTNFKEEKPDEDEVMTADDFQAMRLAISKRLP